MTYINLLCESITLDDKDMFMQITTMYLPQIKRDAQFVEYVDRIAKYYFDTTIKKANPMQQMINSMMSGGNPMAAMMGG